MANKSANISVRVEPETKEQAEKILEGLGVSVSSFINMAYRQVILHRGIPFSVTYPQAEIKREETSVSGEKTLLMPESFSKRERMTQDIPYMEGPSYEAFSSKEAALSMMRSAMEAYEEEMKEDDEKTGLYTDDDLADWIGAFHRGEIDN